MDVQTRKPQVVVIGGGFAGLAAAYELALGGAAVTVLEKESQAGGLARSFDVGGARLERFYHHLFNTDVHILELIRQLGAQGDVLPRRTSTGIYVAGKTYRLSTPMDLLRLKPLSLSGRIRLGLMTLRSGGLKDWQALESLTAREWLLRSAGPEVFRVIWEPLLRGKFGRYAPEISAAWFWSKLKLRGGSRNRRGGESLLYLRGGFASLVDRLCAAIRARGGRVELGRPATGLEVRNGRLLGVCTDAGMVPAACAIATQALPLVADMVEPHVAGEYVRQLREIEYLASLCLVLELDRKLSDFYWLNVNDPSFPFVGVIEHTNFEPPETYGGRHVVYLSKYLSTEDPLYRMRDPEVLSFSLPHILRMFPHFRPAWIRDHHVFRAGHSQPVVVRQYSRLIPGVRTPIEGLLLCSMAQIYPADRGTNHAVQYGRRAAATALGLLGGGG